MTEEMKLPVPPGLEETLKDDIAQVDAELPTTDEATEQTPAEPALQEKMLQAILAQGDQLKNLGLTVKEIVDSRQNDGADYLARLEQQNSASTGNPNPGPVDWDGMTQQELAQSLSTHYNGQMANLANQFGELLEVIAPQWDGWQMRDAIYGLMGRGHTPKQAYDAVKKAATSATPPPTGNGDAANATQDSPEFKAAVEKAAQELANNQRRQANAGAAGKPARNDARPEALTKKQLHDALWDKWVDEGQDIPDKFSKGL